MPHSWIPLLSAALEMQAYQTGTYVAAGSWCEILSQPKLASGPGVGGSYTTEAALGNLNGKVYLTARFALQSIIPRHKSSEYRAYWDSPTQAFYVTERTSNFCRSNFPKIPSSSVVSTSNVYRSNTPNIPSSSVASTSNLYTSNFPDTLSSNVVSISHVHRSHIQKIPSPSAVTPKSKTTNPSRVEEDMTQAVNISKMDGSSSLTSIRNQPTSTFTSTSTSTSWADMVDEELEEIAYTAQSLNISTSTLDSEESKSDGSSSPTSIHSQSTSTSTSWADMVDEELEEITQTAQDSVQDAQGSVQDAETYIQNLRTQTADNLWGAAIRMLNYEMEPEKVHHFNFVNAPVMYKSATSPAVSMWAIKTAGLIGKRSTIALDLKYVLVSQAGKYVDPVSFDGPEQELDKLSKLKGSAFRDAVTGRTCKAYHPAGNWMYDRYDPDDDVPMLLHDVSFWSGVSGNVNMPIPVWPMSDLEDANMEFVTRASDETKPHEGKSNPPVKARGKKSSLHYVLSITDGEDVSQSQQEIVEERKDTNPTSQTLPLPHDEASSSSSSFEPSSSESSDGPEVEESGMEECGGGDDEGEDVDEEREDANESDEGERVDEIGDEEAAAEVAPSEETSKHRPFHPYDVDNYPEPQPSLLDYFYHSLAIPVGRKALEMMNGE